ncbi:MAG TPA: FecR domain-containing protein [Polyangiaceae bacterium]|jgi:ferric-dicitrate binding protein FerR (iron transport regulator)
MSEGRPGAARRLERLGERMREATPPATLQEHLEGRARLIAAVEEMRRPSARLARLARPAALGLSFAVAAAAAVLLFLRVRATPAPAAAIAWHVENGAPSTQGYVSVPPTASSARLVFDDGSDVTMAPGSRGRVAATTPVGAELVLEQGRARVHVQHRDRTKWLVDAGPFAVKVTGTEFFVAWAADAETLDVWMTSGKVEVTGPVLGDALSLATGQHLRARLKDGAVQIDAAPAPPGAEVGAINPPPTTPAPDSTLPPTPALPLAPAPSLAPALAPAPALSLTPALPSSSWSRLVTAGQYARVVHEADAEGVPHALATRSLADLRALGDAARYAGNPALARRAYAMLRGRFPSSGDARTAAFLIGRIAEEQDHSGAEASRWYDAYLSEAPGGAYAGDALGRKMVIVTRSQGRDAARPLAARYLRQFPGGPYAAAARDLSP